MHEYNQSSIDFTSSPASPRTDTFVPQFSTADYGKRPTIHCNLCSNGIASQYFKVNGQKVCSTCAEQARSGQSTASRGSLMGALLLGSIGAILAMIIYSVVTMATGWTIGYLAIAVGWIVGKSVMAGASGVGSSRIQAVALLFTYAAISLNELPLVLYQAYNHPGSVNDWPALLQEVAITGVTAPFVHFNTNPLNAGLSLVILLIGLRIAWRLTQIRPLAVAGPFDVASA